MEKERKLVRAREGEKERGLEKGSGSTGNGIIQARVNERILRRAYERVEWSKVRRMRRFEDFEM